jgi:hypothetical protein
LRELLNRVHYITESIENIKPEKTGSVKHLKYNLILIYSISPAVRGEEPDDLSH